jgi:hypothetical protein
MGAIAERTEFYRGKIPLIEDFSRQRRELLGIAASRNFSGIPGQLIGAATELELRLKQALSSLNYEITAKAIDRELTQAGLDYSQAYKESVIQWEIDKAGLLDVLTRELADGKSARDNREQVLAALAIEVGLRQVALINAKTLLEIEAEGYKKKIVEKQGLTLPLETQLAEEKLLTAQRKLAIIPHLQALISAEEDLILVEEANSGLTENLIVKRLALIPVETELVVLKEFLIQTRDVLTAPLITIADKKILLAEARLAYETLAEGKVAVSNTMTMELGNLNWALQTYAIKKEELVAPYMEKALKLGDLIAPSEAYADALLETIPYIEDLATARQALIVPGLAKAQALGLLIAPMLVKAQKTLDYAASLEDQSAIQLAIKGVALEIEELKKDGVDADLSILASRLAEGDSQKALVEANLVLKALAETNRAALLDQDAQDTVAYTTVKSDGQIQIVAIENEAIQAQVDTKATVSRTRMAAQYESVVTTIGARAGGSGSIERIATIQAQEREATASIAAAADITSTLIHQIS